MNKPTQGHSFCISSEQLPRYPCGVICALQRPAESGSARYIRYFTQPTTVTTTTTNTDLPSPYTTSIHTACCVW